MPSIKPQSRAIEGALKTRGEFSIEKHAGLCLISRGDGNGSFVLRYRAPSGGKKAAYTLTGDARSVLNSGPVDGLSGMEHLYRRTNQILTDLKVSKVDPRAVDIARKASGRTYSDLFEEWHERHAKREKRERSWRDDRDIYERHIKPRIGADTLTEIKVGTVRALLEAVVKATTNPERGHYGKKANDVFAIVRASFRWGKKNDLVVDNPCVDIERPVTPRKRKPKVSDEQLRKLWHGLSTLRTEYQIIGRLSLLIGKRVSSFVGMEKSELALGDKPLWTIPPGRQGNKNGEEDLVCLPPLATELLRQAVARAQGSLLFTSGAGSSMDRQLPSKAFAALAAQLGIEITFHDARHIMGTQLAKLGVPAEIRQRVLHHVTGRKASPTTDIYDEYDYLDEKRRALELWQARIFEIIEDQSASGLRWETWAGAVPAVPAPVPDPAFDKEYGPALG